MDELEMTKGSPLEVTPRSTGSHLLWQDLGETEVAHCSPWQKLAHLELVNFIWSPDETQELTKPEINKANAAWLHSGMLETSPIWFGSPVARLSSHFIFITATLWVALSSPCMDPNRAVTRLILTKTRGLQSSYGFVLTTSLLRQGSVI